MQSFIVGILLAGISATSFVAFKYPNGYSRLFPHVVLGVTALFVGVTVWHVAVEVMWANLGGLLDSEFQQQATSMKNRLSPPFVWAAVTYIGVVAFLWVNLKLPPFLKRTDAESSVHEDGA